MEAHYNVYINWENDRKGIMGSPELNDNKATFIEVATPPEFPKGMEGIWSPEHLFVGSITGCLMTTFLAIAENSGLEFKSFSCRAKGKLEKIEGKLMITQVVLIPTVVIHDEALTNKAVRVLKKAEDACLIARSVRSEIKMEINIQVEPLLIASK